MQTQCVSHKNVGSSAFSSLGYSEEVGILEVEFKNGAVYRYFDVSSSAYERLMSASSLGRHLHRWIRGQYRYTKK